MGAVSFSLDMRLVECIRKVLPLSAFVETGSFKGDTVANASKYFDKLITIEFSEPLWKEVVARFQHIHSIEALHGNSPEVLRRIRPSLGDAATLFWLDAHWCVAESTAGDRSQCPLLEEIQAIGKLSGSSVVLIDDARLFLAPPPAPHDITHWPSFDQVLSSLRGLSDVHEIMIVNDVIAYYPRSIKQSMIEYARMYGVDWLAVSPYLDPNSSALKDLEDKERIIQTQHANLQKLLLELEEKKRLIDGMRAFYFVFGPLLRPLVRIARPIYRTIQPRLGNLNQHPPQALYIPVHYSETRPPPSAPRISIVTPSFRQADYIERTIESVLNQRYPNLEYRVQDGGSQDGTVEILKRYSNVLSGWDSRPDNGQSHAINLGFARTSGEIMAWLNSDDILLPGALAYVANYFSRHPEVDVVYGHRILIDEDDRQIGRWMMPAHNNEVLSWSDFIPQETVFWRRRIWDKIGGAIDESFRFAMDWDLLVRFRDAGARFVRLPRFLAGFRIHPNQKTSSEISNIGFQEMCRIRQRLLGHVPSNPDINRAVLPYLLRHSAIDLAWRIQNKLRFW